MINLKIRKVGNSLGVVLPMEAISRLHVEDGDRLFLTETPEGGYRLTHPMTHNFQLIVKLWFLSGSGKVT